MSRNQHVGAGVPANRLPNFQGLSTIQAPSKVVLNVLRVAIDELSHRKAGFLDGEVEAAREWVRAALTQKGSKP